MCRLFGHLGAPESDRGHWLFASERSLLAQSRTRHPQKDGWGIGWYPTGRSVPHVEKSGGCVFEPDEEVRFREVALRTQGALVIGHVRDAANPMGLARGELVTAESSHPFTRGSFLFAHNGVVPYPREIAARAGERSGEWNGRNDSEAFFLLVLHHLGATFDPLEAYIRAREDAVEIWEAKGRSVDFPYSGLNGLFSTGPDDLWAFAVWLGDHDGSHFDPRREYYEMAYRRDESEVVVGSEPLDGDPGWESLRNGEYLHAARRDGTIVLTTGRIPFERPLLLA
jgi:predicted glutamine amidotransferase